jgi:uncharacterized membrane protein
MTGGRRLRLASKPCKQRMYPESRPMQEPQPARPSRRIEAIDIARALALVAMAIYHFTWDLEHFGYVAPGLTEHGGWRLFARCIASSFLFLVGVSLVLANRKGIRWPAVWKRFAMIAAAAVAITLVTWYATPDAFIFFGILHEIALASLIGLLFLSVPALLSLVMAAGVIAAPYYLSSPFFDAPVWWWLGLSTIDPHSNDYVPVFPWFAPVLIGIACANMARRHGVFDRMAGWTPGGWARPFTFAGRHSLAVYLLHQPILFGSVWLYAQILPAPTVPPEARFTAACEEQCANSRDREFCTRYCSCMLDRLEAGHELGALFSVREDETMRDKLQAMALQCTAETDDDLPGQGGGGKP